MVGIATNSNATDSIRWRAICHTSILVKTSFPKKCFFQNAKTDKCVCCEQVT